jgi:EAL domain-containing protein (putative c-di-GMP-specific phosphodiesterase class I)
MAAEVAARKALERDLRQAFETGKLELHFQPELDLRSGWMRGAEALLRWRHGGRGWVNPGQFVAVAETSGLIGAIGVWALGQACRQAKVWRETGRALKVAVNVSPTQCRRADLAATVEAALQETGLPPEALELEVTESVFLREDDETVLTQLWRLRGIGVAVAIDDFGTGYSSLGRLRALPVDKIKIDRSFVARLGQEKGAGTIVRAIVALGHGLGLHVTAEGVENDAQLKFLRSAGCDSVQGFLLGRPVQAKELGVKKLTYL